MSCLPRLMGWESNFVIQFHPPLWQLTNFTSSGAEMRLTGCSKAVIVINKASLKRGAHKMKAK